MTATDRYMYSGGVDTLDLSNGSTSTVDTITLSGTYTSIDGTITTLTSSAPYQGYYVNQSPTASVKISDTGISLNKDCDITLGNTSLKTLLDSIESRLAILVPDPAKLEKFEALKQAYEHYKTLEALCCVDNTNQVK